MEIPSLFSAESDATCRSTSKTITDKPLVASPFLTLPILTMFFHFFQTLVDFYNANTNGDNRPEGKEDNYNDETLAKHTAGSHSSTTKTLKSALDDAFEDQRGISEDINDLAKRIESLEKMRKLRLKKVDNFS